VNSEELEKSLRTEFESYLKDALADMRQEVFQLQYKIDSELEKYKSQIDEVFKEFSDRAREEKQLGESFTETIVEHLRLARDDGATITAKAIAEAEKLEKEMTPSSFDVSDLRDAINDISSQTSQATILSSLINHAEKFVPRGAFFVVKNQNFVGWRVFGNDNPSGDAAIREIFFETSTPTVLSKSVNSLHTVESTYGSFEDDSVFLEPLDFGEPDRMFAVPLIARGRGVAAIYADPGVEGNDVNLAALETLVRIAGLTVELLAASHTAVSKSPAAPAQSSYTQPSRTFVEKPAESFEEPVEAEEETETVQAEVAESYSSYEEPAETHEAVEEETPKEAETEETYQVSEEDEEADSEIEESYEESFETAPAVDYEEYSEVETEDSYETVASDEEESVEESDVDETYQVSDEVETSTDYDISPIQKPAEPFSEPSYEALDTNEYLGEEKPSEEETLTDDFVSDDDLIEEVQASDETFEETEEVEFRDTVEESDEEEVSDSFESSDSYEEADVSSLDKEVAEEVEVVEEPITVGASEEHSFEDSSVETVSEPAVAAPPVRSRLAGRNVDLPIEVSEEERKLHNDARRFARLLVSEIKLYNEQKVLEGRSSGDLYERLREAIDRSREMYDKRVQPPVAERFDYFHYEVVHTLGEGEESTLGNNYPGANV
jgi:hypothetical protein